MEGAEQASGEVASAEASDTSSLVDNVSASDSGAEAASSSPAPEAPEAAPVAETAPAEPEQPALPEFDFDAWNGEVEGLPEAYRPIGTNLTSRWENKFSRSEREIQKLRDLNEALLMGGEDPRIESMRSEYDTLNKTHAEMQAEFEGYKAQIQEMRDRDAEEYAKSFRDKYPEYFEDDTLGQQLSELIDEEWDPEAAATVLKMGEEALGIARKAKADGVPDSYAIRLAETAVRQKPKAEPRPGAKITSGATASPSPNQQLIGEADVSNLDDKRLLVARKMLQAANRRR